MRLFPILLRASLAMLAGLSFGACASETPGSYVNWEFADSAPLTDVAYTITVDTDPGDASGVFWSNQVSFSNGRVAYAGMQTNAGPRRLFLFSVWDVSEYRDGSPGSFCTRFDGEGEGLSCRRWHAWKAGDTYRFHYAAEGEGWWGLTVTNLVNGDSFKLGSVKVGAAAMKPRSVSWVEYYRWNDDRASCESEPYSHARFDAPVANGGKLTAAIAKTSTGKGCAITHSRVTTAGQSAAHANAIGNSVMGRIRNAASGLCLGVAPSGTLVVSSDCGDDERQQWVFAHDATVRSKLFTCLMAAKTSLRVAACGNGQQAWRANAGRLIDRQSGLCLTGNKKRATLAACNGGADQQWQMPQRLP